MRKIPFSKLERTCDACPSQWEYISFDDDFACYIRYRHGILTVYICEDRISDINDCIEEKYLVLCLDNITDSLDSGYLSDVVLKSVLSENCLLEKE